MGMATDPEWVRDMCDVYATVTIDMLEMAYQQEGLPDGLFAVRQGIRGNTAGGHGLDGQVTLHQSVPGAQIMGGHDDCFGWRRA